MLLVFILGFALGVSVTIVIYAVGEERRYWRIHDAQAAGWRAVMEIDDVVTDARRRMQREVDSGQRDL